MKILELIIDAFDELTGVDAVALVEKPAIEADFMAFKEVDVEDVIVFNLLKLAVEEQFGTGSYESIVDNGKPLFDTIEEAEKVALELGCEGHHEHEIDGKVWYMPCKEHSDLNDNLLENYEFESFKDYPESAINAAKRALEWRDSHPDNDCGTRVGWARANQLANKEAISEETIARMASFARHLQHEDVPYSEGCGGLMVDAWGGRAGIEWAQNKLDTIRDEQSSDKFSFSLDEDQQIVVGPLMIPNKLIYRVDEEGDPYFVFFSEDTIQKVSDKLMKQNHMHTLNVEHNPLDTVDGYMMETWLVEDPINDKQQVYGFNYPKGSWMGKYKIEDMEVWQKVKNKEINGFSIEGFFSDRFVQAQAQTK